MTIMFSAKYHKSNVLQEGKMKIQDNKACGKMLTQVKTHFCALNLGQAICKVLEKFIFF